MIIDLDKTEETKIDNFYGGQKSLLAKIFSDGQNRILHGRLTAGSSIGLHRHDAGSEIIYLLSGTGKVLFDGEWNDIKTGFVHYCPKGHEHSLINDSHEDLVFFAVVPKQ